MVTTGARTPPSREEREHAPMAVLRIGVGKSSVTCRTRMDQAAEAPNLATVARAVMAAWPQEAGTTRAAALMAEMRSMLKTRTGLRPKRFTVSQQKM